MLGMICIFVFIFPILYHKRGDRKSTATFLSTPVWTRLNLGTWCMVPCANGQHDAEKTSPWRMAKEHSFSNVNKNSYKFRYCLCR